jgi:hypothetical protein
MIIVTTLEEGAHDHHQHLIILELNSLMLTNLHHKLEVTSSSALGPAFRSNYWL